MEKYARLNRFLVLYGEMNLALWRGNKYPEKAKKHTMKFIRKYADPVDREWLRLSEEDKNFFV